MIVRFNPLARSRVAGRIRALPDIATFSTRQEVKGVDIRARGHHSEASAEVISAGRPGYAVVAGRNLSRARRSADRARSGSILGPARGRHGPDRALGPQRVVGLAEAPDDVGYPLAAPRFYVSQSEVDARFGADPNPQVNVAEIWLRDPGHLDQVLVQARTTSYGLRGLRFVTRSGVRVLLDQAAGIVIDLLVALSVFALATAGVMLAASARAEVQRGSGRSVSAARSGRPAATWSVGRPWRPRRRSPGGHPRPGGGRPGQHRPQRPVVVDAQ